MKRYFEARKTSETIKKFEKDSVVPIIDPSTVRSKDAAKEYKKEKEWGLLRDTIKYLLKSIAFIIKATK